jgi:glycosyltransferase involved in cell wall biosynthesis
LHRALRSISRQTYRDFEVIVVRDGGRPVRTVVEAWRRTLPVKLVDCDVRRGVSHARNVALGVASGEYVAFLDDDDVFLPDHLQVAYRTLEGGDVDVAYSGALVSPRWIEAAPRSQAGLLRKDYPFDDDYMLVANYIHTGSIVARNFVRSTVRFDEEMAHCEDWDTWLAVRRTLRYRFRFTGQITCVYHQVRRNEGAVSAAYQTSPSPFTRARARVYEKWPARGELESQYRSWFRGFRPPAGHANRTP